MASRDSAGSGSLHHENDGECVVLIYCFLFQSNAGSFSMLSY